jgi:hypothetical protein
MNRYGLVNGDWGWGLGWRVGVGAGVGAGVGVGVGGVVLVCGIFIGDL